MSDQLKLEAGLQDLYTSQPVAPASSIVDSLPTPQAAGPIRTPAVPPSVEPAPPPGAPPAPAEEQLVVFRLGEEHYAVNIEAVESIIKMQTITVVPRAPKYVDGLTNLRGDVLLVLDLRTRLGLDRAPQTPDTRIVVCNWQGNKVGMLVDGVSEVMPVSRAAIEPPSPIVVRAGDNRADNGFVRGLAKCEDRLMVLLDLERVLTLN